MRSEKRTPSKPPVIEAVSHEFEADEPPTHQRPPHGAWWVNRLDIKQDTFDVAALGDAYRREVSGPAEIVLEIQSPDGSKRMAMVCIQADLTVGG